MLELKNICYDVYDGNKIKHILKNIIINGGDAHSGKN